MSSASILAPATARAQTAEQPPQAESGIQDIVVTATRREERLQSVPVTVSAVSSTALRSAGVTDTAQLAQVVPGLVSSGRNSAYFLPTIRGVTTSITGNESPIAMYVDGIYQPSQPTASMKLNDIERVEVLRGPQGTLFGRNASGGLINVITKQPDFDPSATVELRYGSFDQKALTAYATGGVNETVAGSLSLFATDEKGYIKDRIRGGKVDGEKTIAARTKWRWTPTDQFSVTASASYINTHNDALVALQPYDNASVGYLLSPSAVKPAGANEYVGDYNPVVRLKQWGLALQIGWELGAARLDTATSYQENKTFQAFDSDVSPIAVRAIVQDQPADFATHEVRLTSQTDGPLKWVIGGYLFYSDNYNKPLQVLSLVSGRTVVPFPNAPLTVSPSISNINSRQRAFSYAGFGQLTYAVTDQLSLIGGLRYTWEKRKFNQNVSNAQIFRADAVFKNTSPMASIQYRPSGRYNFYATYSTGFKSGGFNGTSGFSPGKTTQDPISPEKVRNYEVGLKADFSRSVRLNLSAFHFKYSNQQVQVRSTTGATLFINAGQSNVSGAEAELVLAPVSNFTVHAAASYLDAKYKSFPNGPFFFPVTLNGIPAGYDLITAPSLAGNRMIRAPKFTFSISPEFSIPMGSDSLTLSSNALYSSRVFFDPGNQTSQGGYVLVSGRIAYNFGDDRYSVALWGTNLTDEKVKTTVAVSQFTAQTGYERPRSIGVALQARF